MTVSTLFDGTNDEIASNTGNNLTLGAYTFGMLVHLETIAGLDTWFSLDDGGTSRFAPFTNGTTLGVEHATGTSSNLASAFADWGGWRLVFITKASGTAAPRAHIFNGVSWVHSNLGTAIGNPNGAISLLWIGGYANGASDFSDGEVGWMGLWNEDTTDGNCETYIDYDTLAAKSNAQFFTGTSLLAGGTMADASGVGNNETSRVGATTGVRDLPAWMVNFHDRALPGVTRSSEFVGTTGQPTEVLPAGATTGDLVVVVGSQDGNTSAAASTGWDEIYNTLNGTACRLTCWARVLDGSGDDTLAITLGGGTNTNDFAFQAHLIPAALHGVTDPATDIALGTAATGSDANPNPPSVSVSSGDYLILAMYAADDDDTSNAYMPASYAGLRLTRATTGTSTCSVGTAFAERTAITSENPGTFTMAATEEWVAGTIAIPPAADDQPVTVNGQTAILVLSGVQIAPDLDPLTVAAQTGALVLAGVQGAPTPQGLTVTAPNAALVLSGVQTVPTLAPLTVTAQTGTVVLSGVEGTVDAGEPVVVNAQTGILALSGVSSGGTLAPLSVTGQTAILALSAVSSGGTLTALTVNGQSATLALSGVSSGGTLDVLMVSGQTAILVLSGTQTSPGLGALTANGQTAILVLSGIGGTSTLAALTVNAQTGVLTLSGVLGSPSLEAMIVSAQTGILGLSGVGGDSILAALTVNAQTAILVLSGVAGQIAGQAVTVEGQTAILVLSGGVGAPALAALTVVGQVATLAFSGQLGAVSLTALAVAAQTGALTFSGLSGVILGQGATPGPFDQHFDVCIPETPSTVMPGQSFGAVLAE